MDQKEQVKVVIEKASDGSYSCYADKDFDNFGICGFGDTVEETKTVFMEAYENIKKIEAERGRQVPEYDFIFQHDMQTFFEYFSYLNVSKFAEKAGINQSLMRQYKAGIVKPGPKQYAKLKAAVDCMVYDLQHATF